MKNWTSANVRIILCKKYWWNVCTIISLVLYISNSHGVIAILMYFYVTFYILRNQSLFAVTGNQPFYIKNIDGHRAWSFSSYIKFQIDVAETESSNDIKKIYRSSLFSSFSTDHLCFKSKWNFATKYSITRLFWRVIFRTMIFELIRIAIKNIKFQVDRFLL